MSRLPNPGGDRDTWGAVLNDYLAVGHNPDGTNKAAAAVGGVVPIGAMLLWPSAAAAPAGWMKADGTAIPAGNTAAIAVLGANTPDMRGRAPFGADTGLAVGANDGKAAGARGPAHKHTVVQPAISAHTHGIPTAVAGENVGPIAMAGHAWTVLGAPTQSDAATPTASGGTVGPQGSQLVDVVGYLGLNFIVYVG